MSEPNENNDYQKQLLIDFPDKSRWKVKCIDFKIGAANSGTDQIGLALEVVDDEKMNGKQLSCYLFFTDGTIEKTIKALHALGWDNDDLGKLAPSVFSGVAQAVIEHEADKDREGRIIGYRVRVAWINPIGVAMKTLHGAGDVKRLSDRVKQYSARMAAATATGKGAPAAAPPPAARTSGNGGQRTNSGPPPKDDASWMDDAPPPSENDGPPPRGRG